MATNVLLVKSGVTLAVDSAAVAGHLANGWALAAAVNFNVADGQWDDLMFPSAGINPPGAASDPTMDTTDGRYAFSPTADNVVAIQVQLPHAWKVGSTLSPHLHWSPTSTNTGNVLWQLQYKVANIGEAFPGSWTTLQVLQAGGGVTDGHQLAEFPDIAMTGKGISCMLLMILSRLGSDPTDTYTGDAKLNQFDIHIQKDALGSTEEFTK